MRCGERTGFLMLHVCENTAQYNCGVCGKPLCAEHAIPAAPKQQTVQNVVTQGTATPADQQAQSQFMCRTCLKRQSQQNGTMYDDRDDYYYRNYGYYNPYPWGYYSDNDRRVFDHDRQDSGGTEGDALGS